LRFQQGPVFASKIRHLWYLRKFIEFKSRLPLLSLSPPQRQIRHHRFDSVRGLTARTPAISRLAPPRKVKKSMP
jgi:hypothetical protein